ncbi:purine-nucleoside phosphorylase [candidate division WOR-3 bacterium]|uniref:Purine nucleoside phosphorylase n=1 Tax=candidate division WOR-3 bacterium TaxID=2052148 RepID=A0A660SIQ3_UNCW3|nr:MAG: purine-nucleoside phosphorylase [candidate division WOR-3 bacterium]
MINESVRFIRTKTKMKPRIGIILGTGLGRLAREIKLSVAIPYEQIPNFPVSTVETHTGRLLFGRLEKKEVVAMQGRFHYYEGYSAKEITLPVRVMKFLGVRTLIVSNACGGLNPQFKAGDLMIITDHINLQPENPLRGPNDDRLGPRFPDMYNCYDKKLVSLAKRVALDNKIPVHTGVYVALQGPNLETAAEYRFLRIIGGDVVGMSTVPEVIVARHMGIKVLGVSVITDMGLPDALGPMNLLKIVLTAKKAEPKLSRLIRGIVQRL